MSITLLMMMIRLIMLLKNQFPSFGVLFDTINGAKADIGSFGFITCILFLAFMLMGYIALGVYFEPFHNL